MIVKDLKQLKNLMIIQGEPNKPISGRDLAKAAGYKSHTYMQRIPRGVVTTRAADRRCASRSSSASASTIVLWWESPATLEKRTRVPGRRWPDGYLDTDPDCVDKARYACAHRSRTTVGP